MRLRLAILIKERPSCLLQCPRSLVKYFSFSILCWQIFSLLLGVLAACVGCSFLGWPCKLYFFSSSYCISRFTFLAFVSSWSSPSKNQRKNKSFSWPWGVNSLNWQHLEQQNQLEKWPLKFLWKKKTRTTHYWVMNHNLWRVDKLFSLWLLLQLITDPFHARQS